jgi:hypothetical protein
MNKPEFNYRLKLHQLKAEVKFISTEGIVIDEKAAPPSNYNNIQSQIFFI